MDHQQEKILVLNRELDTIKMMQQIQQLELLNVEMKVVVGWTKVHLLNINFNKILIDFLSVYLIGNNSKLICLTSYLVQSTSTFISTLSNSSCWICCIILIVSSSLLSTSIFSCWWSTCSNIVWFYRSCWTSSIFDFNLCKISCTI